MLSAAQETEAIVAVRLQMMRAGASQQEVRDSDETLRSLDGALRAGPVDAAGALPARRLLAQWSNGAETRVGRQFPPLARARASLEERVEALARSAWLADRGRR